jgi:hypothetical protein
LDYETLKIKYDDLQSKLKIAVEALEEIDRKLFKINVPMPTLDNPNASVTIDTGPIKNMLRNALNEIGGESVGN